MDPTLSWALRIHEAEALINARQGEHSKVLLKEQALHDELAHAERAKANREHELLQLQHLKAAAAASIAQHAINISAAREQLGKGMQCSSMKQQQRELEEQAAQLQLTCTAERQQARRFQELMGSHVQEHGSKGRLLAEMLAALVAKLSEVERQEETADLDSHLTRMQGQADQLRAEQEQLRAALQSSQGANKALEAKILAAEEERAHEEEQLQKRSVEVKELNFKMGRQQAVSEARLQQMVQEGKRMQSQLESLNQALLQAERTMCHLTGGA